MNTQQTALPKKPRNSLVETFTFLITESFLGWAICRFSPNNAVFRFIISNSGTYSYKLAGGNSNLNADDLRYVYNLAKSKGKTAAIAALLVNKNVPVDLASEIFLGEDQQHYLVANQYPRIREVFEALYSDEKVKTDFTLKLIELMSNSYVNKEIFTHDDLLMATEVNLDSVDKYKRDGVITRLNRMVDTYLSEAKTGDLTERELITFVASRFVDIKTREILYTEIIVRNVGNIADMPDSWGRRFYDLPEFVGGALPSKTSEAYI